MKLTHFARILCYLAVIAAISSCQTAEGEDDSRSEIGSKKDLHFPVILDTLEGEVVPFERTWMSTGDYRPYYIGQLSDSIIPDRDLVYRPIKRNNLDILDPVEAQRTELVLPYFREWLMHMDYKGIDVGAIYLLVDTMQIVKAIHGQYKKRRLVSAYPMLIKNTDPDTLIFCREGKIPLIMEAVDSSGKWMPIEERIVHLCSVGLSSWILPPDEIALTMAPIPSGSFKTTLRLRFYDSVSNEFSGTINYRQMQRIFEEEANFEEEYLSEKEEDKR